MSEHDENTEEDFGPKMAALTPRQRDWVWKLVELGNAVDAARAVGYGANSPTTEKRDTAARVAAFSLARNPKVQAAIREEAGNKLYTGALIGANRVMEIAADATNKDAFKAAKLLLEHSGFQIIAQQDIRVTHDNSDNKALVARIVEMAGRMGLDPKKLLGQYGVVVDAEFQMVEDKREAAPSSAGLEDLL